MKSEAHHLFVPMYYALVLLVKTLVLSLVQRRCPVVPTKQNSGVSVPFGVNGGIVYYESRKGELKVSSSVS
jgi:hypothetical protein